MISSKLNGGLGNQLFQIAVALNLAMDHKDTCAFDFNAPVVMQGNSGINYKDTIYKELDELSPKWKPRIVYKESSITHEPILYKREMLLDGYFQSEKYFWKNREFIKWIFCHKQTMVRLYDSYKSLLDNSISIHVRRGDYLQTGDWLGLDYYYKALDLLSHKTGDSKILVFSDDIEWCIENFLHGNRKVYYIKNHRDYEDLYLMSMCTYNITANSSFSWWSAYLNQCNNKMVIMPRPWTASHGNDIYPHNTYIIDR